MVLTTRVYPTEQLRGNYCFHTSFLNVHIAQVPWTKCKNCCTVYEKQHSIEQCSICAVQKTIEFQCLEKEIGWELTFISAARLFKLVELYSSRNGLKKFVSYVMVVFSLRFDPLLCVKLQLTGCIL